MIEWAILGGILYVAGKKGNQTMMTQTTFTRFDSLFKHYAEMYGLDWLLLKAIAMNESSLGTHPSVARGLAYPSDIQGSKSDDGKSWGLMQFTLPTARDFDKSATESKLNDAGYSIRLAAQFVKWLYMQFDSIDPRRTEWVIKSYNQGIGNTGKERRGEIKGHAKEYFERFKRNYETAKKGAA